MNTGRTREKTCTGKVAHTSWESAEQHVQELLAKDPGEIVVRYRCPFCPSWHVGHPRGRRLKVAAARIERARRKTLLR